MTPLRAALTIWAPALVSVSLACGARSDPLDDNAEPDDGDGAMACTACPMLAFEGRVDIATQSDADAMSAYSSVTEALRVLPDATVMDLRGLACIQSVGGNFSVRANRVPSLVGLDCLESVGGNLVLDQAFGLDDVAGLGGVDSIGGHLKLINLEGLDNIDGLSGLRRVGGNIEVRNAPTLPTCEVYSLIDELATFSGEVTIKGTLPDACGP